MIQVENLHKSFGKVTALAGVSFSAPDGQITGLLGPNGAGKTTCLRILYTLLNPDQGWAKIDSLDTVKNNLEVQGHIGALPESHGLYPRLTHARKYPLLWSAAWFAERRAGKTN